MKKIAILGATGSIGRKALDVIDRTPEEFKITSLTAHNDFEALVGLAKKYGAGYVGLSGGGGRDLKSAVPPGVKAGFGPEALIEACGFGDPDMVLIAVVGIAGLAPLLECLDRGVDVALANKESLVCGGALVKEKQKSSGSKIYPIDSEICAIFQCLQGNHVKDIRRVILTASGGPFFDWDKERIEKASVQEALRHPNWSMGRKITVDSATYMNKGFEVIETKWMFDLEPEMIDVVIHRQSTIHSMVEYRDGAVIAQMGPTDMRQPIQYALFWPRRPDTVVGYLDFAKLAKLTFDAPDTDKFPCLRYAKEALLEGGSAPLVLNAANDAAVDLFLREKINFGRIERLVEYSLSKFSGMPGATLEEITDTDAAVKKHIYDNFDRIRI